MITNCVARNNFYTQKPLAQRQAKNDVAFGGGVILAGVIGFSIVSFLNALNAKPVMENNKDKVAQVSGWQPTVKVMAPVGQNVIAFGTDSVEYTSRLLGQLDSSNISTLEEANASISKSGYKAIPSSKDKNILGTVRDLLGGNLLFDKVAMHKTFRSLQTGGPHLGIFNKKEKDKDRFVVIFHQNDVPLASSISAKFYSKIKKIYGLNSKSIIYLGINSPVDFQKGIDSISQKIDSLKDKSKVELLVVYSGHGTADALNDTAKETEGLMEGRLKTKQNIKESHVKAIFEGKLKDIKTLFIIDACHSGAWISENSKMVKPFTHLA